LHFDELRLVALREGNRTEETLTTEIRKQYGSTSFLDLRGPNSDFEAREHGLELHDLKVSEKPRINLRDTWSKRHSGAMRPVRWLRFDTVK
jgi:hypothetical protein